jgi:hypothetical protein
MVTAEGCHSGRPAGVQIGARRMPCRPWRAFDSDAILVVHWFQKKTKTTPQRLIDLCKKRLKGYDHG